MTAQAQLIEQSTRHAVYLERLKSGEANQFASFLKEIDRSIRLRLSGEDLTAFSRTRLNKLLSSVESDLNAIYGNYREVLKGNLIDLAEYESEFEARSLNAVSAGSFEAVIPASTQVVAAVTSAPLSVRGPDGGKLLEPFIKDWSNNEVKRVSGAIRQGAFEGQTTNQILQKVRGTRANKFNDGILAVSNRNAEAIVRTAVQHASSVARNETWNANSDIIAGVIWNSTLDSRTSTQCRSLDGQVFPIDKGPRPPIHIRCRSTTTPKLDKRFDFLGEDGTRSARTPEGKVTSVDANETYYSWLKKQPAAFQSDAIGATRAKLLRDGGLTAERFAELNIGRNFEPLTTRNGRTPIQQMKDLEPTAFLKAGID